MTTNKQTCRRLAAAIIAFAATMPLLAQGYRDVTAEALVNPSFELAADGASLPAASETAISEAYGWTLPTSTSNMALADATTTAIGFTNSKGGVTPAEGNRFLWYRKGWANLATTVTTTTRPLSAGKYYVCVDYKAADYSNNNKHTTNGTTMNISVTDAAGQTVGQTAEARRAHSFTNGSSNPGTDTYLVQVGWTPMGCFFTLAEDGTATIAIGASLVNNGRSDICLDNMHIYRIDDTTATGDDTPFPLDATGMLANPSFEAGAGGTSWTNYSLNGWTVAKTGSEIKAESGSTYTAVYSTALHGLRICNAWDGSATTDKTLQQQVSGLPAGRYRLEATVTGSEGTQMNLFAGNDTHAITIGSGDTVQTEALEFAKTDDLPLALGLQSTVFYKADNFRLYYLGKDAEQASDEYAEALALAQQVLARAANLGDLTAAERTALAEAIATEPEQSQTGYLSAAQALREAAQALATAEDRQVADHYAAVMPLASWTQTNVTTNKGQHWDGTSTTTYYEQKDGWSANAWTMKMRQTLTLPAGNYVLRATGRHAEGDMSMALTTLSSAGDTLASAADFPASVSGLGVNLEGGASILATDETGFANGGLGYGWQWRYLAFSLAEEAAVTLEVTGEAREAHQWMSISDFELLREGASQGNFAVNSRKTTTQVVTNITLSTPVDYVISSATPFAASGSVDIAHEDATIILSGVKPSEADQWLAYVKVNGKAAEEGNNCSIRIYGNGAMIVPYGDFVLPLTIYDGINLTGSQKSDFTAGSSRSLKNNIFNNRIRSFKLKRGYMVTMATKSDGKGYSRVFIADKSNRQVNLPTSSKILDRHVSSIRISKWNDVTKKGYAGNNSTINGLLNTTWCYNWDAGWHEWDDREYVTQHHHEGWPSISNVGNNGPSPNILGNNEPDNTADARETVSSVDEVLAHWQEMMATGKRLGSPAMASNLSGWLYPFIDSIDARGWRCDFIAVHAYYYQDWSDWLSTLQAIHERTGRPIWITEMNYGANWTGWPGSNTNGNSENYAIEKTHFAPVIDGLEQTGWVERYAAYNEVQSCRKLYNSGDASLASKSYLTPMGEYYAAKQSNMAYNSSYGYTPKALPMHGPALTEATLQGESLHLAWNDPNEEFSDSVIVERRGTDGRWLTVATCTPQEDNAAFTLTLPAADGDATYRIRTVDYLGKSHTSAAATVGAPDGVGTAVQHDGQTLYLGGNRLQNADFDEGLTAWTTGSGAAATWPAFEVYPVGGVDGGAFLQAFNNEGAAAAGSLKRTASLTANTPYYIGVFHKNNGGDYQKISLSADGTSETSTVLSLPTASVWSKACATFSSADRTSLLISYRWLGKQAQFDKFCLAPLFGTPEEAYADGAEQVRRQIAEFAAYNTTAPAVNTLLTAEAAQITGNNAEAYAALASLLAQARHAVAQAHTLDSLQAAAQAVSAFRLPGAAQLAETAAAQQPATLAAYGEACQTLQQAIGSALPTHDKTKAIVNADLSASTGWTAPAGTYTGGDQRTGTFGGRSCWNAWWNVSTATAAGRTMALTQDLTGLPMGFYRLTADATTQHYCLSDQHCWIRTAADSTASPTLTFDRMQIADIADSLRWETLSTLPVYVGDEGAATIGFQSSKDGATEGAYATDKREGWWLATGFRLYYTPAYCRTLPAGDHWTTVCLPFAATPADSIKVYTVSGRSYDGSALYLTEVSTMEAGKAYVCHYEGSRLAFLGQEATVSKPATGGVLTGVFKNGSLIKDSYILDGDKWRKVENIAADTIANYSAFIASFADLPVVEGGAAAMTLLGTGDGIDTPVSGTAVTEPVYNTAGQRTQKKAHGVVVGKNRKFIAR